MANGTDMIATNVGAQAPMIRSQSQMKRTARGKVTTEIRHHLRLEQLEISAMFLAQTEVFVTKKKVAAGVSQAGLGSHVQQR